MLTNTENLKGSQLHTTVQTKKHELVLTIPNGKEKIIEHTCRKVSDHYSITIFRDVTATYHMEKELIDSERKFQRMFEDAIDGLVLWDDTFKIVDLNSAAERILGFSKIQLIGSSIRKLFVHKRQTFREVTEHIKHVIREGKYNSEIDYQCRDGNCKQIELTSQHELIGGLNLSHFRDVTEKKQCKSNYANQIP